MNISSSAPRLPQANTTKPAAKAPAPTSEPPAAVLPKDTAKMTTLQRHIAFFDRDGDGKITIAESKAGLKALGLNGLFAQLGALFINLGLASHTDSGSKTVIDVRTIHQAMHDSDSGILDANGQFVKANFDAMFDKYDANKDGKWTSAEIAKMQADRKVSGKGSVGSKAEFGLLMKIASDGKATEGGKEVPTLSRERLQKLYDGTLFPELAAARAAAKK